MARQGHTEAMPGQASLLALGGEENQGITLGRVPRAQRPWAGLLDLWVSACGEGSSAFQFAPDPPWATEAVQNTRHLKGPSVPSSHDHGGPATQGRWHRTAGGDPAWGSPEAGMALPHLHLHTQAVEEMSREGQAVHGRECGINPAWGRQMWLALTAFSRQALGGCRACLAGTGSAPARLTPTEGALAWPRVLSGWALQEGDCVRAGPVCSIQP